MTAKGNGWPLPAAAAALLLVSWLTEVVMVATAGADAAAGGNGSATEGKLLSLTVSAALPKVDMEGPRAYGEILGAFLASRFCAAAVAISSVVALTFAVVALTGAGGKIDLACLGLLCLGPGSSKPVKALAMLSATLATVPTLWLLTVLRSCAA